MVAALAAILAGTLPSASAAAAAETRVGASSVVVEVPVGPRNLIPQVSGWETSRRGS